MKKQEKTNKEVKEMKKQEKTEELFDITKIKIDKSYIYISLAILVVIVLFYLGFVYMQSTNFVEYNNLKFERDQQGSIVFYTTKIPFMDYSTNQVVYQEVDFRNNPVDLKDVPVNIQAYLFKKSNVTYISYFNGLSQLEDGPLAVVNLGIFLRKVGLITQLASNNKSYEEEGLPYVTCSTNPNNTLVMLYESSRNSVIQVAENCYILSFKGEDILRVTEKFQLAILEKIMTGTGKA